MGAHKNTHLNLKILLHLFHILACSYLACILMVSIHGREERTVVIVAVRAVAVVEIVVDQQCWLMFFQTTMECEFLVTP